jgi:hypothetical protein
MAKKAKSVSVYPLWDLISDDSRRALVFVHQANAMVTKAHKAQIEAISALPGMSNFNPMAVHSQG